MHLSGRPKQSAFFILYEFKLLLMKPKNGPKSLNDKISEATKGIKCPVHAKEPKIIVDQIKEEVSIEACCNSFKTDVNIVCDRVLRAWKLHGEHLRARKNERDY